MRTVFISQARSSTELFYLDESRGLLSITVERGNNDGSWSWKLRLIFAATAALRDKLSSADSAAQVRMLQFAKSVLLFLSKLF
jgi:hypothetical protein